MDADNCDSPTVVAPPGEEGRRARLYAVSENDVLDIFARMGETLPGFVRVPKLDIPAGAVVQPGVYHDWFSRTFQFAVTHPSFPVVADGAVIPRANEGECDRYEAVRLATLGSVDLDSLAAGLVSRLPGWQAEAARREAGDPEAEDATLRRWVAEFLEDALGG